MFFGRIQLKESPAVSGRSKSGDAAAVALLSKGYGDIALVNFVRTRVLMEQGVFDVYWIDMKYIRNLHNIDDRILSVSPQVGKEERPFLGIIIPIVFARLMDAGKLLKAKISSINQKGSFTQIGVGIYLVDL